MVRGHRKNGNCSDVVHNGQTVCHVGYRHEPDAAMSFMPPLSGPNRHGAGGPFDSFDTVKNDHQSSAHGLA